MTIDTNEDLEMLARIGRIVALTVQAMAEKLQPGITTGELDAIGEAYLEKHGARSAPQLIYNYPGVTCISVNEEAAHGVPGERVIQAGDLVNIDVSAELDGYFADTGASFPVPPTTPLQERLLTCTRRALQSGIGAARAGDKMNRIGRAVEVEAGRCGFSVVTELTGHGVGRHLHEDPRAVLNYYEPRDRRRMRKGMVFTIEPFLSTGAGRVVEGADGWTLSSPDGSLMAQYEHTIVVTEGSPIIVTQV